MLILATLAWGTSFPLTKASLLVLEHLLPERSSWSLAGLLLAERFALAAAILGVLQHRKLGKITQSEIWQGIGLGLFASLGSLLQTDGLHYTDASTSAFLTQFTCVLVPVALAIQRRKLPSTRVILSCVTVLVGVGILSGVSWSNLHIGRGEAETLLCAVFFTGQILCLEVTRFHANDPTRVTLIMFTTVAAVLGPFAAAHLPHARDFLVPIFTPALLLPLLALVFLCTLFAFGTMNRWQRHVGATEAGLIYSAEPLSTSLFALFLPAWLSWFAGISYANERPGWTLLIGGGLITAGNVLMLLRSKRGQ